MSSMELTFLGTGSAFPSPTRSTSCLVLQHGAHLNMFDCGEGSQIQMQKSQLKASRVRRIFITHMHGDHVFGLPGMLCLLGYNPSEQQHHVDIYGPTGLRNYLRTTLALTYTNLACTYSVHEIKIPSYKDYYRGRPTFDAGYWERLPDLSSVDLPLHQNERDGRTITANDDGSYDVCSDDTFCVTAVPLTHTVPCVGYVWQENDLPGKLDSLKLVGKGVPKGPMFGKLKSGLSVTLANGTTIHPHECVGPSRTGRKLVILGDTCNSDKMAAFALHADVLVHEATNENVDEEAAKAHGHSTAGMAGRFASRICAKTLILTHVSQRYKPLGEEGSIQVLIDQASEHFTNVIGAQDLLRLPVPLPP